MCACVHVCVQTVDVKQCFGDAGFGLADDIERLEHVSSLAHALVLLCLALVRGVLVDRHRRAVQRVDQPDQEHAARHLLDDVSHRALVLCAVLGRDSGIAPLCAVPPHKAVMLALALRCRGRRRVRSQRARFLNNLQPRAVCAGLFACLRANLC